jgi:hypothetical protein
MAPLQSHLGYGKSSGIQSIGLEDRKTNPMKIHRGNVNIAFVFNAFNLLTALTSFKLRPHGSICDRTEDI